MNDLALTPAASAAAATDVIRAEVRTLTVTGPDIQSLLHAVRADIEIAPTMEIDSDDLAAELQDMLGRLATVSSAIEAERKERGAPLRDTLQWLMDGYTPARDSFDAIIEAGKRKLTDYLTVKREAQRRAEEEAARLRHEEAARRAAEEANALIAAQKVQEEAASLRAAGSEDVAAAMETQAMVAVDTAREHAAAAALAVYTPSAKLPTAPAVKGASQTWKAECVDKAALIVHVGKMLEAGDRSLIKLLELEPRAINQLAKVQQQYLNVPGLRPYAESRMAVRKQAVAA